MVDPMEEEAIVTAKASSKSDKSSSSGGGNNPGVLDSPVGKNVRVSSVFREYPRSFASKDNLGTDYAVPTGTPIPAVAPGIVAKSGFSSTYGNIVVVNHGPPKDGKGNVYILYAHASVRVEKQGQEVITGNTVIILGATGHVTGLHLPYEVLKTTAGPFDKAFFGDLKIRNGPASLSKLL